MVSGVDPSALRAAREKAGLTQHALARLVGAAGGERVSRWELGTSEPRPAFIARLARILGLPALQLIRFEGAGPDLRALRLQAGLTARELADRTNLSLPTYLRWESGRWDAPAESCRARGIAGALDESVDVVAVGFRAAQRLREVPQLPEH